MSAPEKSLRAPIPLRIGAFVSLLQCLVAYGFGISLVISDFMGDKESSIVSEAATSRWVGVGTGIFIFIVFGAVAAGAVNLLRERAWGRSPIVLIEILLILISTYMFSAGQKAAAAAVAISAVIALVCVLHPQSSQWAARGYDNR